MVASQSTSQLTDSVSLLVPVWGESYTALFCNICLPLWQTEGNIDYLIERHKSGEIRFRLIIVTTVESKETILSHPSFIRISENLSPEFIEIPNEIDLGMTHDAMSWCYRRGIEESEKIPSKKNIIFFLTPDSFFSAHSFRYYLSRIRDGKSVIMITGLRIKRDAATPALQRILAEPTAHVSSAELVDLCLAHLHPISEALVWDSEMFNKRWPSNLYFRCGQKGLIAHNFHLHPVAVAFRGPAPPISGTVDGEFLDRLGLSPSDFEVVVDSDHSMAIELSPDDRLPPRSSQSLRLPWLVIFALTVPSPIHWHFFRQRALWKGTQWTTEDDAITAEANWLRAFLLRFRLAGILLNHLGVRRLRVAAAVIRTRIRAAITKG